MLPPPSQGLLTLSHFYSNSSSPFISTGATLSKFVSLVLTFPPSINPPGNYLSDFLSYKVGHVITCLHCVKGFPANGGKLDLWMAHWLALSPHPLQGNMAPPVAHLLFLIVPDFFEYHKFARLFTALPPILCYPMSALNFPSPFQSCLRSHLSCELSLGLSSSITSSLLFITYRVLFKTPTLYSNSLFIRLPLQLDIKLPRVGIWGLVLYFDHLTSCLAQNG